MDAAAMLPVKKQDPPQIPHNPAHLPPLPKKERKKKNYRAFVSRVPPCFSFIQPRSNGCVLLCWSCNESYVFCFGGNSYSAHLGNETWDTEGTLPKTFGCFWCIHMEKSAHEAFEKQGESEKAVRQTVAGSRSGRLIKFPAASLAWKSRLKDSDSIKWLERLFFFFFFNLLSMAKILRKPVAKTEQNNVVDQEKSILVKLLPPSDVDTNLFSTDGSALASTSAQKSCSLVSSWQTEC